MSKCILFIDGENLLHKIKDVVNNYAKSKSITKTSEIDFDKLFDSPLQGLNPEKRIFYAAKLHRYQETKKKSDELISSQRKLRNRLISQGYEFEVAGNVRGQKVGRRVVFKEKGVDVRIAVDLVSMACDATLKTAILCSSDSDLQPAITELRKRNVEVIYLGFENQPNKGLTYTTNRTILIRNSEVLSAYNNK